MYCRNCGKEVAGNEKFCRNCGAQINAVQSAGSSFAEEGQSEFRQTAGTRNSKRGREPRRGDRWWKILLVIIVCAAAVAVFFFVWSGIRERQLSNHMEDGKAYMENKDYEQAVAEFSAVIGIDPKEVPAYQQLAEAYIELDEPESAEKTYDDARQEILTSYAGDDLLDGAEDLYEAAITYYGEKGYPDEVKELVDEISDMLPNEEEAAEIKQLGQTYIDDDDAEKKGQSDEEERPSEEQVADLLETFKNWASAKLLWCYSTNIGGDPEILSDYETIDAADAYIVAAQALWEDWDAATGVSVIYLDGTFYSSDEYNTLSTEQQKESLSCVLLSTPDYEEYLRNLFGEEYSLDDFPKYDSQGDDTVLEDADGHFYIRATDYINEGVDISIADLSDTPDEEGLYTVLVEYTVHWAGGEPDDIYYMQYRIAPDASSGYGCRIVGMVPAGGGEVDPEFLPESNTGDTDEKEETGTEDVDWEQIYADYIENWEDADEDRTYEAMFINDDDIPELFVGGYGGADVMGAVLFYIHNGQVEEYRGHDLVWYPSFIERKGYIYSLRGQMGGVNERLAYLDENSEMTILFDGEYYQPDYNNPSADDYFEINGEKVIQADYEEEAAKIASWMENDTEEWDGTGIKFATGATEAVQKLRSGEAASIIGR